MKNIDPTPSEFQRIDRGENEYADAEWLICPSCGGGGQSVAGGKCQLCAGEGELPYYASIF